MKELSTVYADITKVEKDPVNPAYRLVHARISDETKDLDGQRADYNWLKTALPDWFQWGNVRDMHENNVVAKAKKLTDLGPDVRGFDGVFKAVDPIAVMKLDEELFTGVSIGIKGPRVLNEKGVQVHPTQPGWIKGGKIVEVSFVDHPCNESCKLTVLKDAGSGLMLIKGAKLETLTPSNILEDGALYWYKRAKWNAAARRQATSSGHAMADGRFPIDDASDVSDAVHLYNTGHGKTPDVKAHIVSQAKRLGLGNPFKKKNQTKLVARTITAEDLEAYQKRFNPAFANAGVSLSDGSYLIMDEGDIDLAKGLRATGFGNTVAADILIQRREKEFAKAASKAKGGCGCCADCDGDCTGDCCSDCTMGASKAAGATQQSTPRQADHASAPGARENRDNPDKNAPPPAKPKNSKNPDKETPAHQQTDASGSKDAEQDSDGGQSHEATHPPKKVKKGDKTKKPKALAGPTSTQAGEVPSHTHGDDTGSVGSQTNSAKKAKIKQTIKTTWPAKLAKFANGDPADWSDKKLTKALKAFKKADSDAFKTATNSYTGDGRPLLEQIARSMQGRVYSMVDAAQAGGEEDNRIDAPKPTGDQGVLNDGNQELVGMRDGDPRISHATPAQGLGQSGPMSGGNAVVTPSGDAGVPNTSLPFASAPQQGADRGAVSPGALPGTLAAPGDADPSQRSGGPGGSGGMGVASPPLRAVGPAAQSGPATEGGRTRTGAPNTAFANPQRQDSAPGTAGGTGVQIAGAPTARSNRVTNTAKAAKPDKKGKKGKKAKKAAKAAKMIDKLAKGVVADRVEAAIPDSTKAAVVGLLKKFRKDLEKSVLTKYATADQLKAIQSDIEKLGAMARPGGPFVGQITSVDKVVNANEMAQPQTQTIEVDVMEQMERYEKMSKSSNRALAASASAMLNKLLTDHFPPEVLAELNKRRRSPQKAG